MSDSISTKQSFSMDDFAKALEQYDYEFSKGKVIKGTVVQYESEGAYVDIGGKSPAFVPTREAALGTIDNLAEVLPLNQELEFLIIREQNDEGQVTLSRRQLQLQAAWDNVAEIAESGKSVQVRITGVNKGGVTGEIEGLRGFIPRSHLEQRDNLDSLVGQLLTATFLEVNPDDKKLVLSQRGAIQAKAMAKVEQGTLVEGKIVSLKPYGVFVDLDGATGLLHIKEVSNTHINSLTTIFKIGQIIKVVIAEVDEYKNRLSLSIKVLEEYPGEIVENLDQVMATAEERWQKAKEQSQE
ncbi:RNA binding S1 domain protein [Stanieria cyanosphaera PCC 7437]|uniref:RNA binding S1 domain protein n=1 Tax=Stanieria cyanosphaera (strain ATCC 29371 / PCC 7437) TaxID=111780 RepID=K9XTX0_STAC7|nr:S1 RNA-binding domain-containing protein [Stanieria cyanosphaera]AFZ35509.1 RNA binding S1 domain protein [Stanieria cyanosphaera PCC 7437]